MKPHSLTCFAVAVFVTACSQPGYAESPPETTPRQSYAIYAGDCSRSIRIAETYQDAPTACRRAAALRHSTRYVGVVTGKFDDPLTLLPAWRDNLTPATCSVYRVFCKTSEWSATTRDLKHAETLAKAMREKGDTVEIVYHFPEK